ncbi:MAG: ATP-binding cassette domain-containing protein [Alphaproteobacteria bacterium]|nr:ATP-binding cassette domain-containing protein [Alphaproteobacteria bacterium]
MVDSIRSTPVLPGLAPAAVVRGVSYAYGDGANRKVVLENVELVLDPGKFVVLTGHSGAGKTTLLTLIGAIRSLQNGYIDVLGVRLTNDSERQAREVRRRIGFIFQDHNLFGAISVFRTLWLTTELADMPLSRMEAMEKALGILKKLNMSEHLHAFPGELSTGQKQRIAVARALMNDPKLILGDEPTASLDHAASMLVVDLIKEHVLRNSASALIVTHDERIFDFADHIIRLEDGQMVLHK